MSDSDSEYVYSSDASVCITSDEDDQQEITKEASTVNDTEPSNFTETKQSNNTSNTSQLQLVAEMTGLSVRAAGDLLVISNGDVQKACSIHFGEDGENQSNPFSSPAPFSPSAATEEPFIDTPAPWHLVAEMTGLSLNEAKKTYDLAGSNVELAVMLHFEGAEAIMSNQHSSAIIGKTKRRRQSAEEQLRAAAGIGYDAFDAYKEPVKKINRRQAKKEKEKLERTAKAERGAEASRRGFQNLDSSDTDEASDSSASVDVNGEEQKETETSKQELEPPSPILGKNGKMLYFTVKYTKKKFQSMASAENFMKSKKYRDLLIRVNKDSSRCNHERIKNEGKQHEHKSSGDEECGNGDEECGNGDEECGNGDEERSGVGDTGKGDEVKGDNEDEWVTDEEEDTPWVPSYTTCLFNNHESTSFEENVQYMNHQFSFFVPQVQHLVDPHGLFSYLQEKITRYNICIQCNRIFNSIHSCRRHMLDSSHCKFNLNHDLTANEFYSFKKKQGKIVDGQLVLKHGAVAGHRDMTRYYKQNVGIDNQRVAVIANRRNQLQRRLLIGLGKQSSLQKNIVLRAERKARNGILTKSHTLFKGTSKAIASNYTYKPSAADNKQRRAIVHHAGSHFHMAGTRQFHRGVRVKGIKMRARHGSKLSSVMVRKRVKSGNSSSNRGNRRFDHRRG
jgi:hypothetical protein